MCMHDPVAFPDLVLTRRRSVMECLLDAFLGTDEYSNGTRGDGVNRSRDSQCCCDCCCDDENWIKHRRGGVVRSGDVFCCSVRRIAMAF